MPAAMYNRRKKAKLVISRRNWVVVGGGTEDFAWFTLVVHVFVYSWQVNACPDSKNWPKREMVTRSKGNIKCLWSSFISLRAEEKWSIEITTIGVSIKHFKMTPTGWEIDRLHTGFDRQENQWQEKSQNYTTNLWMGRVACKAMNDGL